MTLPQVSAPKNHRQDVRMRIAHVSATFPPYYCGTGNVCYHNARVLAERGHDVHVFTSDYAGAVDDPQGVKVHRLQSVLRLGNAPLLPRLIGLRHFDVIHLHCPFIFGAELVALGVRLRQLPLVITYHNELIASDWRKPMFSLYERLITPDLLSLSRRIGVVALDHAMMSARLASRLQKRRDAVIEIPNGVDIRTFMPRQDSAVVRAGLGIPASASVAAFIGGLDSAHYFKRVDVLLRAVAATGRDYLHALIVGDGNLLSSYKQLASDLGIENRCHFVGAVAHSKVPTYLSASDFLVLPSDSVESFGLVLIESMACGKPVIASNLPGVRTVVEQGIDGVLIPPGDIEALTEKLIMMADNDVLRIQMGTQGRRKVAERYSWERIGERLEATYLDVLAEKRDRYAA